MIYSLRHSLASLLFLSGAGLVAFHAYEWMRYGVWATYSCLHLLLWSGDATAAAWAEIPQSWLGIHQFLGWLPLWALCWLLGSLILAWPQSDPVPSGRSSSA